jgi:hypothetical protein
MAKIFFREKDHYDDQGGKMEEDVEEHRDIPQPQYIPENN